MPSMPPLNDCHHSQASTTSSTDSTQLQTIRAVQIEIARMEEAEQTHSDASKALASLCKKLGMADGECCPASS